MAKDILKTMGSGKKTTLQWVLIAVAAIIVITILVQVYKALKGGSQVVGKSLGDAAAAQKLGLSQERVSYIREKAVDLWNDSSGSTWFWLSIRAIDKNAFISAINSMNNTIELGWLNESYKEAAGIKLIQSITGSFYPFNETENARLKSGYLSYLKS